MTFDLFTIVIKEEILTIDINHAFDSITITIKVIPATINFVELIAVELTWVYIIITKVTIYVCQSTFDLTAILIKVEVLTIDVLWTFYGCSIIIEVSPNTWFNFSKTVASHFAWVSIIVTDSAVLINGTTFNLDTIVVEEEFLTINVLVTCYTFTITIIVSPNVITNLNELVTSWCIIIVIWFWILFAVCIQDTVLVIVEDLTSAVLTITITQLHPISEEEVLFTIDSLFTDCHATWVIKVVNISVVIFDEGILSTFAIVITIVNTAPALLELTTTITVLVVVVSWLVASNYFRKANFTTICTIVTT